jgi:hypothetical protein
MSDGPPIEEKTVSAYLDYLALACIFGIVESVTVGRWAAASGMFVASLVFHLVGIKWPQIRLKAATLFDWDLWGKRIAIGVRVLLTLAWVSVVVVGYYAWHTSFRPVREQPSPSRQVSQSAEQPPKAVIPQSGSSQRVQKARQHVDWHDKNNWRRFLHTGMTTTTVRQLFGDPERMAVVSDSEFWDYGDGQIQFFDGRLWSWSEPSP